MKIDNTRAAIRRYELRRAPEDHQLDPEVPDDPGSVHAMLYDPAILRPPRREAGTSFERFSKPSACGTRVRVIFAMAFDTDDPDACPECIPLAIQWQAEQP
jgi:hypothetical protein